MIPYIKILCVYLLMFTGCVTYPQYQKEFICSKSPCSYSCSGNLYEGGFVYRECKEIR